MGEFSRIYKRDLTDRQLASLWDMIREAGRDRAAMFGFPRMDGLQFADWVRKESEGLWAVLYGGELCGMMRLDRIRGKTADVHFCTLPCGTRRVETPTGRVPFSVAFIEYAVGSALWERSASNTFILDTIYGIVPECHAAALKTIARTPAKFLARLPQYCWSQETGDMVDGIVTISTRTEFPQWMAAL